MRRARGAAGRARRFADARTRARAVARSRPIIWRCVVPRVVGTARELCVSIWCGQLAAAVAASCAIRVPRVRWLVTVASPPVTQAKSAALLDFCRGEFDT